MTAASAPVLIAASGGVIEQTAGSQKPIMHSRSRRDHYSGRHHDNAEVLEGRIIRSNPSHRTINPIARPARVREADIGDDRLPSRMCMYTYMYVYAYIYNYAYTYTIRF